MLLGDTAAGNGRREEIGGGPVDLRPPESPSLQRWFFCKDCQRPLDWSSDQLTCGTCGRAVSIIDGIPRFVHSELHDNFSLQWRMFSDVQLDSKNGSSESFDRLLEQSRLRPEDFAGKLVLEVGCGAGRFTEVLLALGARVIAIDYSGAIDACAKSHAVARTAGNLALAQADVFELPFPERAFDIVLSYGMLQHTGDPVRALQCVWRHVAPKGRLLVDRYRLGFRNFLPLKDTLRLFTSRLSPKDVLRGAEMVCTVLLPIEREILRRTRSGGPLKTALRYAINRGPIAIYPIHLELEGKIDRRTAERWSVLDTLDRYGPKFDEPCTFREWRRDLSLLEGARILSADSCGQGVCAVVERL